MLWTPSSAVWTKATVASSWNVAIRSFSQASLVVPAMAENVVRSSTVRAGEPRQIGRLVGCPCSRISRSASGALALRSAPVPLGKIGIEKETRSRALSVSGVALQTRSTAPSSTGLEPVVGL